MIRFLAGVLLGIVFALSAVYYLHGAQQQHQLKDKKTSPPTMILKPNTSKLLGNLEDNYKFYDNFVHKKLNNYKNSNENAVGVSYNVELGSFENEDEQQNLKGNLILLGYDPHIHKVGKFTIIYLGPYKKLEDAITVKNNLHNSSIVSSIVRNDEQ